MVLHSELEADAQILLGHLRGMTSGLRKLPEDKWDWTFAPPAPTPRTLATHTLAWLKCDRQHIGNLDCTTHKLIPEPSRDPESICAALESEADAWESLFQELTQEDLDRSGFQFGSDDSPMNIRGFIAHMVQNVIYKNGQFSTIYFALGLDGTEPYDAPFPNPIYRELLGIES